MSRQWKFRVTLSEVKAAHKAFEENESRDVFYRVATELIDLALRGQTRVSVAESLAVLLLTWNKNLYRFRKFDDAHFDGIDKLLTEYRESLMEVRDRKIEDLTPADATEIQGMFRAFECVLGPVGAAKALHLLAPKFFPLWDRKIAVEYGVALNGSKTKEDNYWEFMLISQKQCCELRREGFRDNALKAIDEFNYCKYTKGW